MKKQKTIWVCEGLLKNANGTEAWHPLPHWGASPHKLKYAKNQLLKMKFNRWSAWLNKDGSIDMRRFRFRKYKPAYPL